jgi:hypothetical protein
MLRVRSWQAMLADIHEFYSYWDVSTIMIMYVVDGDVRGFEVDMVGRCIMIDTIRLRHSAMP